MRRLIVNADDFGLHESINRGISEAHRQGIVTSASLMAGGAAFEDALQVKQDCPGLGIGVHLTLVGGRPVLPLGRVESLVDGQGRFFSSYVVFLARFLRMGVRLAEVEQELAAQIEKVIAAGMKPTHLDSHQHLHVFPGISGIVLQLARRYSIRAVRVPAEPLLFFGGNFPGAGRVFGRSVLTALSCQFRRQARAAGIAATGHFFGMLAGGQMTESSLLSIIRQLPEGESEIMVHPGLLDETLAAEYEWGYHWDAERKALCSSEVNAEIDRQDIRLISYQEL